MSPALCRFDIKNKAIWGLFYLVKKPEEKKCHCYGSVVEMVDDFNRRCNRYSDFNGNTNPMWHPLIWIKSKITENKYLITRFSDNTVTVIYENDPFKLSLKTLFNEYVYLDDSLCGVEE